MYGECFKTIINTSLGEYVLDEKCFKKNNVLILFTLKTRSYLSLGLEVFFYDSLIRDKDKLLNLVVIIITRTSTNLSCTT